MGFFRVLFGFWATWIVIRVARQVVQSRLAKKNEDTQINKSKKATLELLACPYCGVFTTSPCTNPDCPGMGI